MNKHELIYAIFLFIALFSISFIFFSNTITQIDVSIEEGEEILVKVPSMFSMFQVIFLIFLTIIATTSFIYLYKGLSKVENTTKKQTIATSVLEGDEKKLYKHILDKKEILQKDLVYESGFQKVKVTRILEKLDNKQLIIRKPWGNTNKILIK